MKIKRIIDGEICFDDNEAVAMSVIILDKGVQQLHTENRGMNPITAMRELIRFLSDKHNIYTACLENQNSLIKIAGKLGFKEFSKKENIIVFRKD